MRDWDSARIAEATGATLARLRAPSGDGPGPTRAVIDSRAVEPGDLFVGLPGSRVDGGAFAERALAEGAWGVVVQPQWQDAAMRGGAGAVLLADDPVRALGALARAWRRELGAQIIAVTGSVGKTSTKDIIAALARPHRRTVASRANFNTEIGLPLEVLAAPAGTQLLILELAMRGAGQIAELTDICEPDVGVITNIAPVHVEQLGSLEGVARAKAELLVGMRAGTHAIVPAGEALLHSWLRDELEITRFGEGGEVDWAPGGEGRRILTPDGEVEVELGFTQRHQLRNSLAAVAAVLAVGIRPSGRVEVVFSALRGEQVELPGGIRLINDCYNANPLSMRAALDDLAAQRSTGRRLAVLGDMLELGADEKRLHLEIGEHAAASGVQELITVGPRARTMADAFRGRVHSVEDSRQAADRLHALLREGDVVLVKGSRGVALEVVAEELLARMGTASGVSA
ncbi:MAG: UDP-N-acetylmuramoyl-tripeptide--D-alanyl-D-alanine ligase [Actinomycetota bacterium]|nr:UDP-N-acetylmuramoyl-tripeptide--D-alanyl-D-alanine ligase [Actinomycetota bacterium]